jgi:hypothetical protein
MNRNPILDELRHVRESLLAQAGGTLDALVDRLQAGERESDHPAWKPAGRPQGGTTQAPRGIDEARKQSAG